MFKRAASPQIYHGSPTWMWIKGVTEIAARGSSIMEMIVGEAAKCLSAR